MNALRSLMPLALLSLGVTARIAEAQCWFPVTTCYPPSCSISCYPPCPIFIPCPPTCLKPPLPCPAIHVYIARQGVFWINKKTGTGWAEIYEQGLQTPTHIDLKADYGGNQWFDSYGEIGNPTISWKIAKNSNYCCRYEIYRKEGANKSALFTCARRSTICDYDSSPGTAPYSSDDQAARSRRDSAWELSAKPRRVRQPVPEILTLPDVIKIGSLKPVSRPKRQTKRTVNEFSDRVTVAAVAPKSRLVLRGKWFAPSEAKIVAGWNDTTANGTSAVVFTPPTNARPIYQDSVAESAAEPLISALSVANAE